MSEPAPDLKIPLQIRRTTYRHFTNPIVTPVLRALPIYVSRRGVMAHRVRSGGVYLDSLTMGDKHDRLAFSMWCGQGGSTHYGWLAAVPPETHPLCGTCEGRAVGAGYPSLAFLVQRHALLYSPRGGGRP